MLKTVYKYTGIAGQGLNNYSVVGSHEDDETTLLLNPRRLYHYDHVHGWLNVE